ncbi:MAG: amine oxidase [Herminiimonas sp.]|nr:amine oxidase [Herminiimonas sp.]
MQRRSFLIGAGAAALGVGGLWRAQEIPAQVRSPGKAEGHFLRDRRFLPAPGSAIDVDVVILGSGIAGLTAAWKLQREGMSNFLVIDGPELYGNVAGGKSGELAYPTGAHYLPIPSMESFHVREILDDLGIIRGNPAHERPRYDERALRHGPGERILFDGRWQEGLLPGEGVPPHELEEHKRFSDEVERLRTLRGADGKRIFVIPTTESSRDPEWMALDRITFKAWADQQGYRSPTLRWYLDYCCRDDYGRQAEHVSAWAGLHYFCSRSGKADNAEDGAWLTWPGGLHPVAEAMDKAAGSRRRRGTAVSVKKSSAGVEVLCLDLADGLPRTFLVRARKTICAMPLHVAARVVAAIKDYGFDPALHMPAYAPWMVSNFMMNAFPEERPEAPLSWDNVVYQQPGLGLGYVVSTHQDIRVAPPPRTVFTAWTVLSDRSPLDAARWMESATPAELLSVASADLRAAYGWRLAACVERVEITLRPHAMATPLPGFRSNAGLNALRTLDGPVLFAHGDLSGLSLFEEAAWWGYRAAKLSL